MSNWIFHEEKDCDPSQLSRFLETSDVVARLLLNRGVSKQESREFLDASPDLLLESRALPGVCSAVDRILRAISDEEKIIIHGDYDCDGMTATAILYRTLKLLGADVQYFIPSREKDGYGLSPSSVRMFKNCGYSLIVTVDCGIASLEASVIAQQEGLSLIVTDHHQFKRDDNGNIATPITDATVHPAMPGYDYPFHGLCGAAVAFKLCVALLTEDRIGKTVSLQERVKHVQDCTVLAAIGTIADVVPLVDENRFLVTRGLDLIKKGIGPLGVASLIRISGVNRETITSEDVAFSLAPRINSSGRLGAEQLGAGLLITDVGTEAYYIARRLDELNKERKRIESDIWGQIFPYIKGCSDPIIIVCGPWLTGVLGIVAGRVSEATGRPAIVLSNQGDVCSGSGRSPNGVNLIDILTECSHTLNTFGGHSQAAGLSVLPENLEIFHSAATKVAEKIVPNTGKVVEIDSTIGVKDITDELMADLDKLEPFGYGNPKPVFRLQNVSVNGVRPMGNGSHCSLSIKQDGESIRGLVFRRFADFHAFLSLRPAVIDLAVTPVVNEFKGRRSIEVHVIDWSVPTEIGE